MTIPNALEIWQIPAPSKVKEVSFDVPSPETDLVVWKLDLPNNLATAEQNLAQLEFELLSTRQVLEKIPLQIEQLGYQHQKARSGELAFQTQNVPEAEAKLFSLLEGISSKPGRVSYDIEGQGKLDWQKAAQDFEKSLDRLKKMLTQFALVETRFQGRLIGRTVVSWSGKVETTWQPSRNEAQLRLHQRSLQAALASRHLLMNILIVSSQGAAKLSVLLAIPGGAIMALPAVWKFVTRILDEVEKYQKLTKQGVQ